MRLTLRTLLAYLDDTLEPAESKAIGRKIAESQTAQDIVARIREVVRRRRLTAPPVDGAGAKFDANTVAEYIDNSLSADDLAAVEETCLNSDLYLAEMAACHQILTVVVSEPVRVPPMARRRMYGLIQGPEAIPYRKVTRLAGETRSVSPEADQDDTEDMMLLGLPFYRSKGNWVRWLAPLAFALLAVVVAVVIWQTLPSGQRGVPAAKNERLATATPPLNPPLVAQPATPNPETAKNSEVADPGSKPAVAASPVSPDNTQPAAAANTARYVPPSDGEPSILLQRSKGQAAWQRLSPDAPVNWDTELLSLPGCRSTIQLSRGINLILWGTLPGDGSPVSLFESTAVLKNASDVDAEVNLQRGRIGIANTKTDGNARVRVRFRGETWELSLEPGAEVALELSGTPGFDFTKDTSKAATQQAACALFALKGQVQVKVGARTQTMREPPGPAVFIWTSQSGPSPGPQSLSNQAPWATAAGRESLAKAKPAIEAVNKRLTGQTPVEEVLAALVKDAEAGSRRYAIYGLSATDDLSMLLDLLADERAADVRRAAIDGLRHWIGQGTDHDQLLYAAVVKKYGSGSAEIIMHLIHGFSPEMRSKPEAYEYLIEHLKSDKLPIRELAWMNLLLMPETQEIAKTIPYDPASGVDQRSLAYSKWKEIIPSGKMPPRNVPAGSGSPPKKN